MCASRVVDEAIPDGFKAKSMKQNAEEMKLRRGSSSNTLEFVALVLAQPVKRLMAMMAVEVVDPIRQSHAKLITSCKTRAGCLRFYIDWACGRWAVEACEVANFFSDADRLSRAGFDLNRHAFVPRAGRRPDLVVGGGVVLGPQLVVETD